MALNTASWRQVVELSSEEQLSRAKTIPEQKPLSLKPSLKALISSKEMRTTSPSTESSHLISPVSVRLHSYGRSYVSGLRGPRGMFPVL
jgi:hypothetical protein